MSPRLFEREIVPYRWVGHGLDVRVIRQDNVDPLFAAHDVELAMGLIDVDQYLDIENESGEAADAACAFLEGDIQWRPGLVTRSGDLMPLYDIDAVTGLAHEQPTARAADFMPWFHELVDTLTAEPFADDDVAPDPHDVDEPLTDDTVWTIAEAARILAADPALRAYGRDTLFQALRRQLGWIARDAGVWVPSATAEAEGHLQRYRVRDETRRIEPRRVTYPQIRVTRTGLLELHRLLGGVADLALPGIPEPTLLEGL